MNADNPMNAGDFPRCRLPTRRRTRRPGASRGFLCLLATQTLGTLNDNMFRWLAVPVGTHMLGGTEQAGIAALSWGIFWFTLPYLLLPAHAGWLADRFCKRTRHRLVQGGGDRDHAAGHRRRSSREARLPVRRAVSDGDPGGALRARQVRKPSGDSDGRTACRPETA